MILASNARLITMSNPRKARTLKGDGDNLPPESLSSEALSAFSERQAKVFRLFADATRVRIVVHLIEQRELYVHKLCDLLEQPQPVVSHHLALLRAAHFIESRRQGRFNHYRIAPKQFEQLVRLLLANLREDERHALCADWLGRHRLEFDQHEVLAMSHLTSTAKELAHEEPARLA